MRSFWLALVAFCLLSPAALSADHAVRVELNNAENTGKFCRVTFVIENKGAAFESLKLDLVVFNTESIVDRRIVTEMGPVRAGRTMVRTFPIDSKCDQIGAILVNDVSACIPGDPVACLDGLTLSSRVKGVRLYK